MLLWRLSDVSTRSWETVHMWKVSKSCSNKVQLHTTTTWFEMTYSKSNLNVKDFISTNQSSEISSFYFPFTNAYFSSFTSNVDQSKTVPTFSVTLLVLSKWSRIKTYIQFLPTYTFSIMNQTFSSAKLPDVSSPRPNTTACGQSQGEGFSRLSVYFQTLPSGSWQTQLTSRATCQ